MQMHLAATAFLMMAAVTNGQSPIQSGTVVIYGTQSHGTFPIIIDQSVRLKLSGSKKLVLELPVGDHEFESKLGKFDPVVAVHVRSGSTTSLVMSYKPPSMGSIMMGRNVYETAAFTLEKSDEAPSGEFKQVELEKDVAAKVSELPSFHETVIPASSMAVATLNDEQVSDALLQGRHTSDPATLGVPLEDFQQQFGSALTDGQAVSGYSVRIYTAKQWLALQAAIAQHEMRPFSESDVPQDLRRKLLYVVANPSTPTHLTGKNMAAASNVERIVLKQGTPRGILQPLSLDPTTVGLDSALRSAQYSGVVATFPEPDTSEPFGVVVIGERYTKEFEVKEKHLARLK